MSKSSTAALSFETLEEIERLDQMITLALLEIETKILPQIDAYNELCANIANCIQNWRDLFMEASWSDIPSSATLATVVTATRDRVTSSVSVNQHDMTIAGKDKSLFSNIENDATSPPK
ncbi:hypothetical protein BGZ94_007547, partial [Podila epigama]